MSLPAAIIGAGPAGLATSRQLGTRGIEHVVLQRGARVAQSCSASPCSTWAWLLAYLPAAARAHALAGFDWLGRRMRGPAVLPGPGPSVCPDIPLIGFHLVDAIRQGRVTVYPGIERFDEEGVVFANQARADFDDVILATGYQAALGCLGGLVSADRCGFARRLDRVASADRMGLYFVGHNYDTRGGLYNISKDSRLAAAAVAAQLSRSGGAGGRRPRN